MVIHVLPGDSLRAEFQKTNIDGETVVCRECLVVGPVDADAPFEFWDERGRFILAEYGEDEIEYHEKVADELERLRDLDPGTEVNLWFEYELFCSANMWFCLSLLDGADAVVYRVEPIVLAPGDRWLGFGGLDEADLRRCYDSRKELTDADIKLGADLWNAYRKNDLVRLGELGQTEATAFLYLNEVCRAAIEKDTRPREIIADITAEGIKGLENVFPEFKKRAGVYGYGDLQVERLMQTD